MTDMDKAVADTAEYEGYRANPYPDTKGLWTVGEGTCLERNPISAVDWKYLLDNKLITVQLSGAGARWLLRGKLASVLRELGAKYDGFALLPSLVQTILLEMSYQLGVDGVLGFRKFNTLLRMGQYKAAAAEGRDSKWAQVDSPARAEKLMKQLESV